MLGRHIVTFHFHYCIPSKQVEQSKISAALDFYLLLSLFSIHIFAFWASSRVLLAFHQFLLESHFGLQQKKSNMRFCIKGSVQLEERGVVSGINRYHPSVFET